MKFDLRQFNDCGKCSMGTLIDFWDTDVQHLYVCDDVFDNDTHTEVEVKDIEDLFPYLWANPAIITNNHYYFGEKRPLTWFDRDIDKYCEIHSKEITRITERYNKYKNEKLRDQRLDYAVERLKNLEELREHYNAIMHDNQKVLLEENKENGL